MDLKRTEYINKNYYPHLDGLRGVAILLVLLIHFYSISIGWVGVDLFFVLSGFLITNILLGYKPSFKSYKIFMIRRGLRIFPLYFLALFLIFVLGENMFLQHIDGFHVLVENQIYFWTYTQNFFLVLDIEKPNTLNHFWSLAVEEQFYIFWPLVVFVLKKNARWMIASFLFLIFLSFLLKLFSNNVPVNYTWLPYRMDALVMGGVASVIVKKGLNFNIKTLVALMLTGLFMFVGVCTIQGTFSHVNLWISKIGFFAIDLLFACLLLFSLSQNGIASRIRKALTNKPLMLLGKYSYGIYVIHWPVKILILRSGLLDGLKSGVLMNTVLLIFSLCLSYLVYHLFEVHFLKMKGRFVVSERN